MKREEAISYIKSYFSVESTESIAQKVKLSIYQVRRIAKTNNIVKSTSYLLQLKKNLINNRRKWYEANSAELNPTHIQKQLIYGSILSRLETSIP